MKRSAKRGLHNDTNLQILQTQIKDISINDNAQPVPVQIQMKEMKGSGYQKTAKNKRGGRKEGDIRDKKLENILEDINAIKGVRLIKKKLSPIDTSLLLKHG